MTPSDLRPDEWANIVIARIAEAINGLPITDNEQATVRAMVVDTLPRIWPGYAAAYVGPRSACGCPDRLEEDYQPHPGEPCDWSHWHPNKHSAEPREDRFCWKCGGMETQGAAPVTPSERERRIEAAARAWCVVVDGPGCEPDMQDRNAATVALDAADEAVPVVPNVAEPGCAYVVTPEMKRLADEHVALERRVEKAEAAARDFAQALATLAGADARDALARHPSFSGEEGTEG